MQIGGVVPDITLREKLYELNSGGDNFYLEGRINDSSSTLTDPQSFKVRFEDDCRVAEIIESTITFRSSFAWNESGVVESYNQFQDTIEATYGKGICGSKKVELTEIDPDDKMGKDQLEVTYSEDVFAIKYSTTD